MTNYKLQIFKKTEGQTSNPLIPAIEIERIYLNGDDGSCAGYIERRQKAAERGMRTDYDRGRLAKSDTAETTADRITITVDPAIYAALLAAVAKADPSRKDIKAADETGQFLALLNFAKGAGYMTDTAAKRRQRKALAAGFRLAA